MLLPGGQSAAVYRRVGGRNIKSKKLQAEFVGSYHDLASLPKDRLPQIAVAGRSNVGKSTLLNKLVGHKGLAKVSSTPGKTRALNFFRVNGRFYLVDLPGYGYAKVSKSISAQWGKLIETYLTTGAGLIGLMLLLDCRRETTADDLQLIEWLTARQLPTLLILTKTDKINRDQINRRVRALEQELGVAVLPFSALTGVGRPELESSIYDLLKGYHSHLKG